jgi:hypothetical protein
MPKPKPLPPIEQLREVFSYDSETGALTWKVSTGNRVKAGALVGNLSDGYLQVQLGPHRLRVHRVAWYLHHGTDPGPLLVDHIDRDRTNNRATNLRLVDARGNQANSRCPDRPVQVTWPTGEVRRFPTTTAAATGLGCSRWSVYNYARGLCQHPAGLQVSYAPT